MEQTACSKLMPSSSLGRLCAPARNPNLQRYFVSPSNFVKSPSKTNSHQAGTESNCAPEPRFFREFPCEIEFGFAQVHGFLSCAKCKALEGGVWILRSPVIARVGIELEIQRSS